MNEERVIVLQETEDVENPVAEVSAHTKQEEEFKLPASTVNHVCLDLKAFSRLRRREASV